MKIGTKSPPLMLTRTFEGGGERTLHARVKDFVGVFFFFEKYVHT